MYAIVDVNGFQYKVAKSMVIRVPKMDLEPGKTVDLNNVLLLVDQENVKVGQPIVESATVKAKVVSQGRYKKIKVFKKKRRKNYRVLRGHRQEYTELQIDQIVMGKTEKSKTDKTAASEKPKAKKTAPAKPAKSASKTPAKAAPKKQAPNKAAAKTASAKPKTVKKADASKEKKEK